MRTGAQDMGSLVRLGVAGLVLPLVMQAAAFAGTADASLDGRIQRFDCGDNCWLTIKDAKGAEHSALCASDICRPWAEHQAMPAQFVGVKVSVRVRKSKAVDGEGNVMGDADEFYKVTVVK